MAVATGAAGATEAGFETDLAAGCPDAAVKDVKDAEDGGTALGEETVAVAEDLGEADGVDGADDGIIGGVLVFTVGVTEGTAMLGFDCCITGCCRGACCDGDGCNDDCCGLIGFELTYMSDVLGTGISSGDLIGVLLVASIYEDAADEYTAGLAGLVVSAAT